MLSPLTEIRLNVVRSLKIVSDDGIDISKRYGRVLLRDFLRCCTVFEGSDQGIQSNSSFADTNHPIGAGFDGYDFSLLDLSSFLLELVL